MATANRSNICTLSAGVALPVTVIDRSRKRVLTEARREQNRVNQRAFRQKQREQRRQGMQHRCQHSSARNPILQPRPSYGSEQARAPEKTLPASGTDTDLLHDQRISMDNVAAPQVLLPAPSSPLDFNYASPNSHQCTSNVEGAIGILSDPMPITGPPSSSIYSNLTDRPSGFDCSGLGSYEDLRTDDLNSDEESPRALELLDPRYLSRADGDRSLAEDTYRLPDVFTEASPSGLHHHQNGQSQALADRADRGFDIETVIEAGLELLLCGRRPDSTSQEILRSSRLPSPRINCITFYPNKIALACIRNAQSMGFLSQDVIMPQCLAQSPFYRQITPADDPKQLLAALTRPSTPASLKPTLPQLLYPHPAFMDLIPMPVFRSRAITLGATRPHLFDMMELKKDMAVKDGLVLWSSTSSSVSPYQRDGQGQPWDIRSWEAAPWFLRKWKLLVDGEEGEVWRQSLWWQKSRGEI